MAGTHVVTLWGVSSLSQNPESSKVILFFDGVCGLCNRFVDFVIRQDRRRKFYFSPLQSDFAKTVLGPELGTQLSTAYLSDGGKVFEKSDAIIRILVHLGGVWKLAGLGRWVPKRIRDRMYDWVSAHRYAWFGKRNACRIPTAEERARFL